MRSFLIAFAAGAVAGCVFVAVLLVLDIGGLRTLIFSDADMAMPSILLLAQMAGLFGIGVAALAIAEREPTAAGSRRWRRAQDSNVHRAPPHARKDEQRALWRRAMVSVDASIKFPPPHI